MDLGSPIPPPRRRRARPVADAPIDELLSRSEDLTKGWLLALLEVVPLEEAPTILTSEVAREGPRMCEAIVRALADERDLRRLQPGGALELLVSQTGELAGAQGPESTARAVDALGAVIWSALRDSLERPDPDQVSQLSERLGLVMELVRSAALRREELRPQSDRGSSPEPSPAVGQRPVPQPEALGQQPRPLETGRARPLGGEQARPPETVSRQTSSGVAPEALWVGAIEDEIVRARRYEKPLTLLLVELEEAERMRALEPVAAVTVTFGQFAQAVRSVLRRQDILACESETRAWIIARETGRLGAQALGARVVAAVRSAPPWRGAPIGVSVGVAVLGEDGQDRAGLIEAAEESRFAAEARGAGITSADQPPAPGVGP